VKPACPPRAVSRMAIRKWGGVSSGSTSEKATLRILVTLDGYDAVVGDQSRLFCSHDQPYRRRGSPQSDS
jgi:hypothetical protein